MVGYMFTIASMKRGLVFKHDVRNAEEIMLRPFTSACVKISGGHIRTNSDNCAKC